MKFHTSGDRYINKNAEKLLCRFKGDFIMSKNTGMGRKRPALKLNKGMDKCDATSHGKQCGSAKEVSKGHGFDIMEKTKK